MNSCEKIISEYPKDYCSILEEAYGNKMMSEGGETAIESMLRGIDLTDKSLLDFGFGLGGAAYYLVRNYPVKVAGLEVNPWMVAQANQQLPENLKKRLSFFHYYDTRQLPFQTNQFDIIFSKGVLTHVEEKEPLFKEFRRILHPEGILIIDDWLSPYNEQWSTEIQQLCALEDLSLYPLTEEKYEATLNQAGFTDISIRDLNNKYHRYNQEIIKKLTKKRMSNQDVQYNKKEYRDAIEGYQLISKAIKENQLLIRNISAA